MPAVDQTQEVREQASVSFGARITPSEKLFLERAAAIEGRSLTDFVLANARTAAAATIREHEVLSLSLEAGNSFTEALARPAQVIPALRDAIFRNPGALKL